MEEKSVTHSALIEKMDVKKRKENLGEGISMGVELSSEKQREEPRKPDRDCPEPY